MSTHIEQLRKDIEATRQRLVQHPVYAATNTPERLRLFMQHHVYAVWDFMSLLKALQRNLTCVDLPWVPVGSAETRYLINEIVLGEESDVDEHGVRSSHFELYLKAMQQAGCDTAPIETFVARVRSGAGVAESLLAAGAPEAAAAFVDNTFTVVHGQDAAVQAAVFTFGREDLIPDMFLSFVRALNNQTGNQYSTFTYYLERHIEVDGDHHSHLAYRMTEELHGEDEAKWAASTKAIISALEHRIALWDAIAAAYK